MAKLHQNKEISKAVEYALANGFQSGKSGHGSYKLYCLAGIRSGCKMSVWSTPSDPQGHAARIFRLVNHCTHKVQPPS